MPKPTRGYRLGSGPDHQKLMLSGMAADLFEHERLRTTEAKAKAVRPLADRLITLGKDGSVDARRRALRSITDRDTVHKLFSDIAPRYAERSGGYTRVLKLGPRKGDSAPMAIIELVEGPRPQAEQTGEPESRRRLGRRGKRKAGAERPEAAGPQQEAPQTESEEEVEEVEEVEDTAGTLEAPDDGTKPQADAEPAEQSESDEIAEAGEQKEDS